MPAPRQLPRRPVEPGRSSEGGAEERGSQAGKQDTGGPSTRPQAPDRAVQTGPRPRSPGSRAAREQKRRPGGLTCDRSLWSSIPTAPLRGLPRAQRSAALQKGLALFENPSPGGLVLARGLLVRQGEPDLHPGPLRVGASLALGTDRWSFKRTQTAHLFEDALRFEFRFEPLQRAVHGFTFLDGYFWHEFWIGIEGRNCRAGSLACSVCLSMVCNCCRRRTLRQRAAVSLAKEPPAAAHRPVFRCPLSPCPRPGQLPRPEVRDAGSPCGTAPTTSPPDRR